MKINNTLLKQSFSANKTFYASFAFFLLSFFLLFCLIKKIAPLTVSHTVYYCQTLFANTAVTLPHSLPSLFMILLLLVFSTGILIFIVQVMKTRFMVQKLLKKRVLISPQISAISETLGVAKRVDIVKDKRCLSFCYGFLKPRIVLSSQLLQILTDKELKAVLIHEHYHLKNRDPLKIMLGQIAFSMFWFLPILKDLHEHFIVLKEFSADELVIDMQGSAKSLKSALAKVVDYSITPSLGVVTFTANKSLEARVIHLTDRTKKPSFRMSVIRLLMSGFVILFIFVFLNIPIYEVNSGANKHTYLICPKVGKCANFSSCGTNHTNIRPSKSAFQNNT